MSRVLLEAGIKTVSEANCSDHWTKKRKRHQLQQFLIRSLFNNIAEKITLPCTVKLVRLGSRLLDRHDNLPQAFKQIVDEISECLIPHSKVTFVAKNGKIQILKGRCDSDPRITWLYDQEKSKKPGVRIEIDFATELPKLET